mgnify:CR=1 FL=1|tara:strand:- start:24 stop:401 length:378 start_codon:yes stop_codon:yes gene_type:complete
MPNSITKKLLVRVQHEELDLSKFIQHLEEDLVYVSFRKVTNGQFRSIYPFTRNPKYIPLNEHRRMERLSTAQVGNIRKNPSEYYNTRKDMGTLVKAYSLIDGGWRSLYTHNLLFYEVYDQEGDTL